MTLLKTSKGKTFENVKYCSHEKRRNELMISIDDTRSVPEIASDFHGLESIEFIRETTTDFKDSSVFIGFSVLRSIAKDPIDDTRVILYLKKKD